MGEKHRGTSKTARAAAVCCMLPCAGYAATLQYDIVINGGSFSAVSAALAAARTNPAAEVLLIEPTDWLGGQATSQGVAAIDNPFHQPARDLIRNHPELYYPADYLAFLDGMRDAPALAPGEGYSGFTGWVSLDCYDPRTGAWVLENMTAEFANLTVMKLTVVKNATVSPVTDAHGEGLCINSLSLIERTPKAGYTPFDDFLSDELPDWYSPADSARYIKETHTVLPRVAENGMIVIDASEAGDVVVLSGALYTQGREVSTERVEDDGTLPAMNDEQSMAMVYPFCITSGPVDAELELKSPWPDFDAYYAARAADYFSINTSVCPGDSWGGIFTYRRLFAAGSTSACTISFGDVSMQNWNPGNDYRQGTWLLGKSATDAQAADWQAGINIDHLGTAEEHAVAWYFHLKDNQAGSMAFPGPDTHLLQGDDEFNMMGTAHGLAKYPYIRGTRRIVGLDNFRITSRYWRNTQAGGYDGGTSYRYYDSVGIGNYASDVRPLLGSTGISPPYSLPAPFYIPYRALASHNVRNLLACGKLMAQTYITNAGYRLHPIEWAGGGAAGTAAGLLSEMGGTNHDLLPIPMLRDLQAKTALNAPIRWTYTGEPVLPPQDGDLVAYDFQTLPESTPFDVEAYHPTAVRAGILMNGALLAETTSRINGRLLYQSPGVTINGPNPALFEARCYNDEGALIATLNTLVPMTEYNVPCDEDPRVTDNDDGAPDFTFSGTWVTGSAQPNRWCGGVYHYKYGNTAAGTATWRLKTTSGPGIYRVAIWYPESSNRATDSPFTVHHLDGTTTIPVNQRINGGQWHEFGSFPFGGGEGDVVTLTNAGISNPADLVVGDAVRAIKEGPLPTAPATWSIE